MTTKLATKCASAATLWITTQDKSHIISVMHLSTTQENYTL